MTGVLSSQRPLTVELTDFSGGENARDGYGEVAINEFRDGTLNWTQDERAALTTRKGCPAAADFPTLPGNPSTIFYSKALTLMIVQVGTTLYKCAPGGGSWVSFRTTSTSTPVGMCDFNGKLFYVHIADGVRYYNGTTDSGVPSGGALGTVIVGWQNKLWVIGQLAGPYMFWSPAGTDGTVAWNTSVDVQQFREKDDALLTGLFGGPTLIAFKEESHYRVNDSSTGSYTTVDWVNGCVGPRAVAGGTAPQASGLIQEGGIYFWGKDGLYAGDGLRPAVLVGDKLRPRFLDDSKVNPTTKPLICVGVHRGRLYFAYPKTSTTQPDTIIEFDPRGRWMVEHQIGTAKPIGFASYQTSTRRVTVMADASGTKLIELLSSDTRTDYDGSSVVSTLKTGFLVPNHGLLVRLRKAIFTVGATIASSVTFGASYLDSNLGSEASVGLTWGARSVPAGTSEQTWNGSGRAPAFSFSLVCTGVAVTLRRILVYFYPAQR